MGKGDKKSRRGKIIMGSHGVRRPRRNRALPVIPAEVQKEQTKTAPVKEKAPARHKAEKPAVTEEVVNVEVPVKEPVKPARKKAAPKAATKEGKKEK